MNPETRKILWIAGAVAAVAAVFSLGSSLGSTTIRTVANRPSDEESKLNELLPSFREKVVELLRRLRVDGFRPMIKQAYRSPEQAQEKAEQGLGIADSMHTLGLAVDIIDAALGWNAPKAFWDALHEHSLSLGLTRVQRTQADGTKTWDLAHVQAVPVAKQKDVRSAKTLAARETILQKIYA